eukprot:GABU01008888.1.p2 GENE.GABU01008888.1~~GABU01008888.1.p2  ORF type:complete len:149 (+),score=35.21 GABU01008888.1:53-448(+)
MREIAELDKKIDECNKLLTPGNHNLQVKAIQLKAKATRDQAYLNCLGVIQTGIDTVRESFSAERSALVKKGKQVAPNSVEAWTSFNKITSQPAVCFPTAEEAYETVKAMLLKNEAKEHAKEVKKAQAPAQA